MQSPFGPFLVQEMTERSVVEGESARSQAAGESEEGSRFSGPETGETWTSEEVQVRVKSYALPCCAVQYGGL